MHGIQVSCPSFPIYVPAGQGKHMFGFFGENEPGGHFLQEEEAVLEYESKIQQGQNDIFDFEEMRISIIKVGSNYYCRLVYPSTIPLEQEDSE